MSSPTVLPPGSSDLGLRVLDVPDGSLIVVPDEAVTDPYGAAGALTAALTVFEFDEAKHPRDAHGRFGDGGEVVPGKPEDLTNGSLLGLTSDPTASEAGAAKAQIARDLAAGMRSSTQDMILAAPGHLPLDMIGGPGGGEMADELTVRDDPSNQEVLAALMKPDSGYMATITTIETTGGPRPGIEWEKPAGPEWGDAAAAMNAGMVRPDDPQVVQTVRESMASQMVAAWAGSSNDSSAWSLALQDSAVKEFGLEDTQSWAVTAAEARDIGHSTADATLTEAVQRDFLRAQYDDTQRYLADQHVTSVTLARGFQFDDHPHIDKEGNPQPIGALRPDWARQLGPADVAFRPLSSFSAGLTAAEEFGGMHSGLGAVVVATVPASQILSTARTGVGCLREHEFVVLGGVHHVNVTDIPAFYRKVAASTDRVSFAVGDGARPYSGADLNEDWIKTLHWDLPTDPDAYGPGDLAKLAALPAGEAMPANLRERVHGRAGLTAAGDFDESKHPRDSHGRFGDGGAPAGSSQDKLLGQLSPRDPQFNREMFLTGEKILGLTGVPNGEPSDEMAQSLKAGVAHDIAAAMSSSTQDLYRAANNIHSNAQIPGIGSHDWLVISEAGGTANLYKASDAPPELIADVEAGGQLKADYGKGPDGELWNFTDTTVGYRADNPNGDRLLREDAVGRLVGRWAGTSNDTAPDSLAMQDAAIKEFGLKGTAGWNTDPDTAENRDILLSQHEGVYRDFLRSQYENTQGYLKGEGISEVTVARGWSWNEENHDSQLAVPSWAAGDHPNIAQVETRPMSSWTTRGITAQSFAMDPPGAVTYQTVPASRILSVPLTGLGCLKEREFIVLGGNEDLVVQKHAFPTEDLAASLSPVHPRPYDADTRNEDWIKTTSWDLPTTPEAFEPGELAKLARLPAGEAMPANLRAQVHGRGGLTASVPRNTAETYRMDSVHIFQEDARRVTLAFDETQHPRDSHGRFGDGDAATSPHTAGETIHIGPEDIALKGSAGGSGTPDDPIYVGKNLDQAVSLLAEGKSIRLDSTKEASVLVSKLGEYSKTLRDQGEKSPNFDLCRISVGGTNLFCSGKGVPRAQMPQLRAPATDGTPAAGLRKDPNDSSETVSVEAGYVAALRDSGVSVTDRTISADMLRPTQSEINGGKTGAILNGMLAGRPTKGDPAIWVSKDGYILDGHHRWAASIAESHLSGGGGHTSIPVHEVGMEIGAALDFTRAFTQQQGLKNLGLNQFGLALIRLAALALPDATATVNDLFRRATSTFEFDESKHPRDSHGRFGEGDGANTIKIPPLPPRTDPTARGHAVDKTVKQLVDSGKDTESVFDKVNNKRGVYLPEREAQHREIVDDMFARAVANGAQKGNDAILMGGLPGAGKSTATRDLFDKTRFVEINPDEMKEELVARGMAPKVEGMGPMEGVGLIHEESSTLSGMLANRAVSEGYNVLYDITMGTQKGVDSRLAKVDGYHTTGVFVDVSTELSAQSVVDRYATALAFESDKARYVPSEVVRNSVDPTGQFQSINRAVFEQTKPRLDNWAVYARTTSDDMHLVEASPGTVEHLHGV